MSHFNSWLGRLAIILAVGTTGCGWVSGNAAGAEFFNRLQAARKVPVLSVRSVEVETKKANGQDWDPLGGAPDLYVLVRVNGVEAQTGEALNTFNAFYGNKVGRVEAGDEVNIVVMDSDPFDAHDFVGAVRFTVTQRMIDNGRIDLDFGQVRQLTLDLD